MGTAVKKEEIERDGGRNERGRGGETEKRERRKNSVPVQKPTKGEGRREGLEYPERCIQVKRGRRNRLLSREGEGGEANKTGKRSEMGKMKIRGKKKCSREESLENKKKKMTEPVKTYNFSHLHY